MDYLGFVFRYFWVFIIIVTIFNLLMFKARSTAHIRRNPELMNGYKRLFRWGLFWLNLPWVMMGIGMTIGDVPTLWHFFRPQDHNPYVLAFYGSVLLEWVLGTFWLFLRGGAEMIVRHPGLVQQDMSAVKAIKFLWLLILVGGLLGIGLMLSHRIPLPIGR